MGGGAEGISDSSEPDYSVAILSLYGAVHLRCSVGVRLWSIRVLRSAEALRPCSKPLSSNRMPHLCGHCDHNCCAAVAIDDLLRTVMHMSGSAFDWILHSSWGITPVAHGPRVPRRLGVVVAHRN